MLPRYKKIAYGMGRFGSSLLLTLVGLTTFWIYGTVFELNWILDGIATGTSYIVIGLTHWLTGYYSDNINTRWGRRKPFVIIGAPGLSITGFLIFVPNWFIDTTDASLELIVFGYYMLFICLFKFFYAFLLTAFQAWLPEITDEDERPLVSSMQNTTNWIASGLGLVFGFITPLLFVTTPSPGLSTIGFLIVMIFAVITVLFYLPSIAFVREKPGLVPPERSLRDETSTILQNDTFVKFIFVQGFASFSFIALTTQIVGYMQDVLLLTSIETLLPPAIVLLISVVIFLYLWIRIIKKIGKGRLYLYSFIVLAILLSLTPILGILSSLISNTIVAILWFLPIAGCMAVHDLLRYVIAADIAQVDELNTGTGRAGVYEGFKGVPLNIFQAISTFILGWFMEYSVVTTGDEYFGYLWWGPLFASFLIIAALIIMRTDVDPDFEALKERSTINE